MPPTQEYNTLGQPCGQPASFALSEEEFDKWSHAMVAFMRSQDYVPQSVEQIVAGVHFSRRFGRITKEKIHEVVRRDPEHFRWNEPPAQASHENGWAPWTIQVSRPSRETRRRHGRSSR